MTRSIQLGDMKLRILSSTNIKRFVFTLLISITSISLSNAQQIPNGDMEVWDTTVVNGYAWPVNWMTNLAYPTFCSPYLPTAERTNDAGSGNWAIKLTAKRYCDYPPVMMGWLVCGDIFNPYIADGIPYNQRPSQFNFYYKFKSVGSDTGYAKITLRLVDSTAVNYMGAIIGEGKGSVINDDTINYTLMSVPINYFLPDTPQLLQIHFATSKTLAEYVGCPPPGTAHIGTTLWIDDITASGNIIGIKEDYPNLDFIIYPNPATETIRINAPLKSEIEILNFGGQIIKGIALPDNNTIDISDLCEGMYFITVKTDNEILTKKFVKQ